MMKTEDRKEIFDKGEIGISAPKRNHGIHGVGLTSIRRIAAQYHYVKEANGINQKCHLLLNIPAILFVRFP